MLDQSASCNYFKALIQALFFFAIMIQKYYWNYLGAINDAEIENWAALKIQNSFKEYKNLVMMDK